MLAQHTVADLTQEVALSAADLSIAHKLPMADSFVLAHAQRASATLVTLDDDFAGLPGATVLRKP
jgi:toxin FitB